MADAKLSALGNEVKRVSGSDLIYVAQGLVSKKGRPEIVTRHYKYVASQSNQPDSALYQDAACFQVGDRTTTDYFDFTETANSGATLRCVAVRNSQYGGTIGTFTNDALGPVLEGLWHRWAVQLTGDGRLQLRHCGIRPVEGVTGWHTRFAAICAYSKANRLELTGEGVMSCTETVFLDRVYGDLSRIRFQGGTHQPNGSTIGSPTFFTAAQANTAVTIAQGSPVTVTMAGHGFANDKEVMFGTAGKLPGGLSVLNRYFVRNVTTDTFELATSAGGASINSATAGNGTHYCFYSPGASIPLPSQNNITTQDVLLWNGKVKRLGIVVRAGTNGSNKDFMRQHVTVWGDGNSDWTTPPSCLGIRHEADDSPNAIYDYSVNYCYVHVGIQGPSEKHRLTISGVFGGILCYMLKDSSADTLRIDLHGANMLQWYGEHQATDTSTHVEFDCEGRDDPFTRTNNDMGADLPAILIRNGKATTLGGECRSINGLNTLWVDGLTNSPGTSTRYGADTLVFSNLRFVHGYGKFVFKAVRHVSGQVHVKDWSNENTGGGATHALVYIGRVNDAAGLQINGNDINTTEGVHVGGSVVGGYYPYGADLGHFPISMGTGLTFNPDSADGTAGTERSGSSGFPTALLGANIEKMKGGRIGLAGLKGNITLGANISDMARIVTDYEARRYTITKDAGLTIGTDVDVGYTTLSQTDLNII